MKGTIVFLVFAALASICFVQNARGCLVAGEVASSFGKPLREGEVSSSFGRPLQAGEVSASFGC
jgi:hypothetical protein